MNCCVKQELKRFGGSCSFCSVLVVIEDGGMLLRPNADPQSRDQPSDPIIGAQGRMMRTLQNDRPRGVTRGLF